MNFDNVSLRPTADFHVHLREGAMMEAVIPLIREGGVDIVYVMVGRSLTCSSFSILVPRPSAIAITFQGLSSAKTDCISTSLEACFRNQGESGIESSLHRGLTVCQCISSSVPWVWNGTCFLRVHYY